MALLLTAIGKLLTVFLSAAFLFVTMFSVIILHMTLWLLLWLMCVWSV